MSRPIHEVKPLQARLVRSWETRLEVRVLSVFSLWSYSSVAERVIAVHVVPSSNLGDSFFSGRSCVGMV